MGFADEELGLGQEYVLTTAKERFQFRPFSRERVWVENFWGLCVASGGGLLIRIGSNRGGFETGDFRPEARDFGAQVGKCPGKIVEFCLREVNDIVRVWRQSLFTWCHIEKSWKQNKW